MEPDTAQQDTQEATQEQEEEDEADPVMLAKKQKQLARRGVSFEAKVDPKVGVKSLEDVCGKIALKVLAEHHCLCIGDHARGTKTESCMFRMWFSCSNCLPWHCRCFRNAGQGARVTACRVLQTSSVLCWVYAGQKEASG